MATQTYMTAKLNLADGTIVYPQISLDNIVKSISDPTLVTVAQLDGNSKVSISNLPVTTSVTNSNSTVPTNGAVYGALNTKQATLVEGDNIIHIVNGSTIMADITNLDVAGIDQTATNGVHLTLSGNTVGASAELATDNSAGVLAGASDGVKLVDGVAQFDNTTVDAATAGDIVGGTAAKVIQADDLESAICLSYQYSDVYDAHNVKESHWGATYTVDAANREITIGGTVEAGKTQGLFDIYPAAYIKTKHAKWLLITEVRQDSSTVSSIAQGGTDAGHGLVRSTSVKNEWVRLASLFDTTTDLYTSYVRYFFAQAAGTTINAKIRNISFVDVTDVDPSHYADIVNYGGPDAYLYEPGAGVLINGKNIEVDEATPANVMAGVVDKTVTPNSMKSTFSVGQAVDCTANPYLISGTWTTSVWDDASEQYVAAELWDVCRGTFRISTTTSSTNSQSIGFGNYPKAAALDDGTPLKYLFICDLTNNGTKKVTLNGVGSWDTTLSGYRDMLGVTELAPGASGRVAFCFTAYKTDVSTTRAYLNIYNTESALYDITISHLRQFEVMALTDDAIKYLALDVADPDNTDDLYLIKDAMVDPWTSIIDMKQAPAVTIASGLIYKSTVLSGSTCTFSVDTVPSGVYGKDAHLVLFVREGATVVFQPPLSLMNPLSVNSGHNITIKYRDGFAYAYVDDTDTGYTVTLAGGTENGSLYYGLTSNTSDYIIFSPLTDEQEITLPATLTSTSKAYTLVGNGMDKTNLHNMIINNTKQSTISNIKTNSFFGSIGSLTNVLFTGTPYKTEAGGSGILVSTANATTVTLTGCTFSDIYVSSDINQARLVYGNNSSIQIYRDCVFSNVESNQIIRAGAAQNFGTLVLDNCTFHDTKGRDRVVCGNLKDDTSSYMQDCVVDLSGNTDGNYRFLELINGYFTLKGTNTINCYLEASGTGGVVYRFDNANTRSDIIEGSTVGLGTIVGIATGKDSTIRTYGSCTFSGLTIFDFKPVNRSAISTSVAGPVVMDHCTIRNNIPEHNNTSALTGAVLNINGGTFTNCVFTNNRSNVTSGTGSNNGLFYMNGNSVLRDCIISGNTISDATLHLSAPTNGLIIVENCQFINNKNTGAGGVVGMYSVLGATYVFRNTTFSGNSGSYTNTFPIGGGNKYDVIIDNCNLGQTFFISGDQNTKQHILIRDSTFSVYPNVNYVNPMVDFEGDDVTSGSASFGSAVMHLIADGSMSFTASSAAVGLGDSNLVMAIGSYTEAAEDENHVNDSQFVVGGTYTVNYITGTTVLSGIGTYIHKDGTNNFSDPYMVTAASGDTGTLADGLANSTAPYVTIVDPDLTTVSATLEAAVTDRVAKITTADGMTIVGGTFSSIPSGTTVSISIIKDTDGLVNAYDSTVSILGGSITVAGTNRINGKLLVDTGFGVADGAVISGARGLGYNSLLASVTPGTRVTCTSGNVGFELKNLIITDVEFARNNMETSSKVITLTGCTVTTNKIVSNDAGDFAATNCILQGQHFIGTGLAYRVTTATLTNCTITGSINIGTKRYLDLINCTWNTASATMYRLSRILFKNSKRVGTAGNTTQSMTVLGGTDQYGQLIVFDGTNVFNNKITTGTGASANTTEVTYLISGTTINLSGNSNTTPIVGFAGLKVGTFADATNYSGTWTTGGSATIVTSGGTYSVSGEGTYINRVLNPGGATPEARGTDLTVAIAAG